MTDELRTLIEAGRKEGTSRYRLAEMTGVSEATLSRLAAGMLVPRVTTAEKIADALGYELVLRPKRRR